MGTFSVWHWLIVAVVVLLLFGGRGKISGLMGDFAQGIKAFKKGMAEDDTPPARPAASEPVRTIPHAETAPGTAIPASHVAPQPQGADKPV